MSPLFSASSLIFTLAPIASLFENICTSVDLSWMIIAPSLAFSPYIFTAFSFFNTEIFSIRLGSKASTTARSDSFPLIIIKGVFSFDKEAPDTLIEVAFSPFTINTESFDITLPTTTTLFFAVSTTDASTTFSSFLASKIAAKSLTLTAEISSAFSEISGRAKAVTAIAASGSTYKYFKRAQGFDFSFNIIVIRLFILKHLQLNKVL